MPRDDYAARDDYGRNRRSVGDRDASRNGYPAQDGYAAGNSYATRDDYADRDGYADRDLPRSRNGRAAGDDSGYRATDGRAARRYEADPTTVTPAVRNGRTSADRPLDDPYGGRTARVGGTGRTIRSDVYDPADDRTQLYGGLTGGGSAGGVRPAGTGRRAARRAAEEAAEREAAEREAAERLALTARAQPELDEDEDRSGRRRSGRRRTGRSRDAEPAVPSPRSPEPGTQMFRVNEPRTPEPRTAEPSTQMFRVDERRNSEPRAAEPGTQMLRVNGSRVPEQRDQGWRQDEPAPRRASATTTARRRAEAADDAVTRYASVEPIRDAALSTSELVKVHGQAPRSVTALDGITLDVERGRFTTIMGASGSGKSTLLHCLAGLDKPTRGKVLLGTTDLTRVSERTLTKLRRDRIGFVFQSYDLLPQLTVRQNILLPIEVAGAKLDEPWMDTVLDALELGGLLRQLPSQLSGGEQQRVAVARAVLSRPDVVLADEPTGALDAGTTREMVGFLRASVDHLGQTVVMVTHDPLAAQHADRAVILHEGRLMGEVAQPTAHGVLDALAALADTDLPAGGVRPDATPSRRSERKANSRWPSLRRRAARHT